jgi:L-fuculose-phosphate aldolase
MGLRQEIVYYSKLCHDNKFLAAVDGNLSARTINGYILTTATHTCKGFLTLKDIIKTEISGKVIQGSGKISSEYKLHKFIYEQRKDVNAVIHTHPTFVTAFASAGIALDKIVFPEIYLFFGKIPLAKYATPSTDEMPDSVAPYVKDYDAIMLANHGLVTFGKTLEEAYFKTEKVEHIAEVSYYTKMLGGANELTQEQVEKLNELKKQITIRRGGVNSR